MRDMDLKLIQLESDSKEPPKGRSWKRGISDDPVEHARWLAEGYHVGLPLEENNRSVLDFDGPNHENGREYARQFYQRYRELCTFIVETAAGNIHFHFRGSTKTRKIYEAGKEIGDIKGNGYVVWIGSTIHKKAYRLIQGGELKPFPEHLFPIEKKEDNRQPIDENDPVRRLIRAREWMKKREGKADGNGRGLQLIKTCRALFGMFGLTEDQVWPLILEFNERNVPPYSEKQLRHKVEDAQKGGRS